MGAPIDTCHALPRYDIQPLVRATMAITRAALYLPRWDYHFRRLRAAIPQGYTETDAKTKFLGLHSGVAFANFPTVSRPAYFQTRRAAMIPSPLRSSIWRPS